VSVCRERKETGRESRGWLKLMGTDLPAWAVKKWERINKSKGIQAYLYAFVYVGDMYILMGYSGI